MPKRPESRLGLVTAPDLATARLPATAALQYRQAACANLIPGVESHFWWKDALESGTEILIVFKTLESHVAGLERFLHAEHPYDTPEFLVLPVDGGSRRYLDWIAAAVQRRGSPAPRQSSAGAGPSGNGNAGVPVTRRNPVRLSTPRTFAGPRSRVFMKPFVDRFPGVRLTRPRSSTNHFRQSHT